MVREDSRRQVQSAANFRHHVVSYRGPELSSGKVQADRETLKAARVRLGMEQDDLAKAAGLSRSAVSEFENGKRASYESTQAAIQQALEARGIVFTNGDKPGFYFNKSHTAPSTSR
jgi:DNA-binding XRE family transcriptional regulator